MANNRAVVSEYDEREYGTSPTKKPTASNALPTTALTNGQTQHPVGVIRSDGGKRTLANG